MVRAEPRAPFLTVPNIQSHKYRHESGSSRHGAVRPFLLQLTACRGNIISPTFAHDGRYVVADEDILETLHRFIRRSRIAELFRFVQGNQIDLRSNTVEQPHQISRILHGIGYALQQDVLKRHTLPMLEWKASNGIEQLLDGV